MSSNRSSAPHRIHLVRDVLDKRLKDRNDQIMGRVDRIALHYGRDGELRALRIESGASAIAQKRLNLPLGRGLRKLARRWGLHHGKPSRFSWSKIQTLGIELHLDIDKNRSVVSLWERWLRTHIVCRIPGAKKP